MRTARPPGPVIRTLVTASSGDSVNHSRTDAGEATVLSAAGLLRSRCRWNAATLSARMAAGRAATAVPATSTAAATPASRRTVFVLTPPIIATLSITGSSRRAARAVSRHSIEHRSPPRLAPTGRRDPVRLGQLSRAKRFRQLFVPLQLRHSVRDG